MKSCLFYCCLLNPGLIILNKPYGLQKERKEEYKNDLQLTRHPSIANIDHLCFTGVLPQLKEKLSVDQLNLVKLPERFVKFLTRFD